MEKVSRPAVGTTAVKSEGDRLSVVYGGPGEAPTKLHCWLLAAWTAIHQVCHGVTLDCSHSSIDV